MERNKAVLEKVEAAREVVKRQTEKLEGALEKLGQLEGNKGAQTAALEGKSGENTGGNQSTTSNRRNYKTKSTRKLRIFSKKQNHLQSIKSTKTRITR